MGFHVNNCCSKLVVGLSGNTFYFMTGIMLVLMANMIVSKEQGLNFVSMLFMKLYLNFLNLNGAIVGQINPT